MDSDESGTVAPPISPEREAAIGEARQLAVALAAAGLEHKAQNVEIIDVVGKVDYTDFVVVMSGRSDRHVSSLTRNVAEDVRKAKGVKPLSLEGLPQASWVLMDFGDVIVHLFHGDTRGYYDLESLWIDAPRVGLPSV